MYEIAPEPYDSPEAVALRDEYDRELRERYAGERGPGAEPDGDDVVAFLIARDDDGTALGCGALRSLGEPVVEIRRMFVRPAARGRGMGVAILEALEREALGRGFKVVRLEAGPLQPEAVRLYAKAGYREVPCFGSFGGGGTSRCFERRLGELPAP